MPRSTPTEVRRRTSPTPHQHTRRPDREVRIVEHQHFREVTRMLRLRRSARPPSLSTLTPGTVVWAWVSWRESGGGKVRPAVILDSGTEGRIEVIGLSSVRPDRPVVALPEGEAFLSGPSGCQLHRSWLDRTDIVSVAGHLSPLNRAAADAVATTLTLQTSLHTAWGAR